MSDRNPLSFWSVLFRGKHCVVQVSLSGRGFFLPGQDAEWGFSHASEWIREVTFDPRPIGPDPREVRLLALEKENTLLKNQLDGESSNLLRAQAREVDYTAEIDRLNREIKRLSTDHPETFVAGKKLLNKTT